MKRWIWPSCKACGGTGTASSGGQCVPCEVHGTPTEHRDMKPANVLVDRGIKPENDPALEGFA